MCKQGPGYSLRGRRFPTPFPWFCLGSQSQLRADPAASPQQGCVASADQGQDGDPANEGGLQPGRWSPALPQAVLRCPGIRRPPGNGASGGLHPRSVSGAPPPRCPPDSWCSNAVVTVASRSSQPFRPASSVSVQFLPLPWCRGPRSGVQSQRCGPVIRAEAPWGRTGHADGPVGHHTVQGSHQDVWHVVCQHLGANEDLAEFRLRRPLGSILRSIAGKPGRENSPLAKPPLEFSPHTFP